MSDELVDRYSSEPLREWIKGLLDRLDDDAVGLYAILPMLRRGYGLDDAAMEAPAREVLAALLARGARPVQGYPPVGGLWQRTERYGDDPAQIVDSIISEWRGVFREPGLDDVWFAMPALCRGANADWRVSRPDRSGREGSYRRHDGSFFGIRSNPRGGRMIDIIDLNLAPGFQIREEDRQAGPWGLVTPR